MCLVSSVVGSGDKADCVVGANRVMFCKARMWRELFIVDGRPAYRRLRTMQRWKSMCTILHS